jgi:hypothetical protein
MGKPAVLALPLERGDRSSVPNDPLETGGL